MKLYLKFAISADNNQIRGEMRVQFNYRFVLSKTFLRMASMILSPRNTNLSRNILSPAKPSVGGKIPPSSTSISTPSRSLVRKIPCEVKPSPKVPPNVRNDNYPVTPYHTPKRRQSCMPPTSEVRRPTSEVRRAISDSQSASDRYIPSRAYLDASLSSAMLYSAERTRRAASRREPHEQSPPATPLQTEYKRCMRKALLETSNDEDLFSSSEFDIGSVSLEGTSELLNVSSSFLYTAQTPQRLERPSPIRRGSRILSFKQDAPFQTRIDSLNNTPKLAQARRAPVRPRSVLSTIDPFSQNTLRILSRTKHGIEGLENASLDDIGSISSSVKKYRKISSAPTRILDAPDLVDDYYLNLISWGTNNILAVALGRSVYLWDAHSEEIDHLLTLSGPEDYVTSVSWCSDERGSHIIAVGTNESGVQIWDASELKMLRTLEGHTARVGSLSWSPQCLASGGRDSLIIQHDLRAAQNRCATYVGHTQEVCGLRWNAEGSTLASGGNENYLCIWDAAMSGRSRNMVRGEIHPRHLLTQHQAAVKALDWCPFHRGLLASGGGTADRTIKFWNTNSGAVLNSIDTGSQVCALMWSKQNKELCSSHGYSENQLVLWEYPTMNRVQEFTGHNARVLHMEQSPDGSSIVSAAADETLRFWEIFKPAPTKNKQQNGGFGTLGLGMPQIR